MINNKTFEHRPIDELFAIVKNSLKKFDAEGLIDNGTLIKTVMYCNDKLGITIREIKEVAIPVINYRAKLPLDFEKLYYMSGLQCTNSIIHNQTNPFDNNFDSDIIYEAKLDRECLGNVENYQVIVNRITNTTIHNFGSWIQLDVDNQSDKFCHVGCPNRRRKGKYTVTINKEMELETEFRNGTIYMMYIGMMKDEFGNILFPFHPMITPWYEACIKEQVIKDAIFNSDINREDAKFFLQLAESDRAKAYIDAWNITLEKGYGEYVATQRKRELGWYNQYFKYFQ